MMMPFGRLPGGTNKKENSETVVTGSLDDLVKVWKW